MRINPEPEVVVTYMHIDLDVFMTIIIAWSKSLIDVMRLHIQINISIGESQDIQDNAGYGDRRISDASDNNNNVNNNRLLN